MVLVVKLFEKLWGDGILRFASRGSDDRAGPQRSLLGSYQTEFTQCEFRSNLVSKICSSCVGLAIESVPVDAAKLTVMFVMDSPVAVDAPERSALWMICAKPGPSY